MAATKTTRILLLGAAVAAAAGLGAAAIAHEFGGGHGPGHRMHFAGKGFGADAGHPGRRAGMRLFRYLDANEDGAVERDEATEVVAAKRAEFDADADGALSLAEFEALWLDFERGRMVDRFQHLDEDGDGRVTVDELERPIAMAFRFADRNEDGAIDRSDFRRWGRGYDGDRGRESDDD